MREVILAGGFYLRRMARDLSSLVILFVLPLVLIPILGAVFSWIPKGVPYLQGSPSPRAYFASGFLIMFQLFGGGYSLSFVRDGILSPMGDRISCLPCGTGPIVLGILWASTLMSLCQGLLVAAMCGIVLGVVWAGIPALVLVILGVALLSQLVYLALVLGLRSAQAASSLGWFFAYGSSILGGLIFPLPVEKPLVRLLVTYGGPYSLAQTALRDLGSPSWSGRGLLCLGMIYGAALVLALVVKVLAARRLA